MSFRILVVPEDPTYDQYILKPLVARIAAECGKPKCSVLVLLNPKANGYAHAKQLLGDEIPARYPHYNLILFLPDADGNDRSEEFDSIKEKARAFRVPLLCCAAIQEIEIWLLAGHKDKLPAPWSDVRREVSLKERYFKPFLDEYGSLRMAGQGREPLMKQTLENYRGLLELCPELKELEREIRTLIEQEGMDS